MWENAAPPPQPEEKPRPYRPKSEEDLVLWAQVLLCLAVIGFVLAARSLGWPVYPELRRAFAAALQPEQSLLLGEERGLLRFTEQTAQELADAARSMWEDVTATPETARTRHSQPSPPAYASEESYEPAFALCFPLPGQHDRRTSGYGWRTDPIAGEETFHRGTDLACSEGTLVLAAMNGVVIAARRSATYGNYLCLSHSGGQETLYAHLQCLFVRAGEVVQAGQPLGTAGETGRSTGAHLHFELLEQGVRYDAGALLGLP